VPDELASSRKGWEPFMIMRQISVRGGSRAVFGHDDRRTVHKGRESLLVRGRMSVSPK
jgi:hypothetical protein